MKLFLVLLLPLVIVSCTTVPVKQEFPIAPISLMTDCEDFTQIPLNTTKMSDVVSIISDNYYKAHDCRGKVESWIKWYDTQSKIYNK